MWTSEPSIISSLSFVYKKLWYIGLYEVFVREYTSLKSPTTLGITWIAPTFNGGTSITNYLISIAKSDEDFSATPNVVTDKNFKAEGLTAGISYKFRI